jgi:AcrR family transcriptional regulator
MPPLAKPATLAKLRIAEKIKSSVPANAKGLSWTQDPDGVRRNILEAARAEFVEKGLSGSRVDEIAARISTSKRMIYYYFKDKEGLYIAVLEQAYERIRGTERMLDLSSMSPVQALVQLAGSTFDHHAGNPDFVRLVMIENIHHAKHLKISAKIGELNRSAIQVVTDVYARGVGAGVFREHLSPLAIHLTMSALSFYNVSNRATILQVFGYDMGAPDAMLERRKQVIDTVLRFVLAEPGKHRESLQQPE